MKTLNLALLGLGRAGQFHLQSIRAMAGVKLLHVVDTDAPRTQRVAAEWECQAHAVPDQAFADARVQAVIVATPTWTHHDYILAALKAGKAVLTEKPLGTSLKEVDACFHLAGERGLPLFVGFMRRFDPSFASLVQQTHQGAIGTLQMLRTTSRDSPLPTIEYIKTSHGIFHDCIVHDLDMIRFIAREDPVEVFAMGSNFVDEIKAVGDLDNVLVALKFPSGLLGSIDVNRNSPYGYDQRIEVFGSKGMLQAENRLPLTTVLSAGGGIQRPSIEYSFPTRYREAYRLELEAFRDCVLEKKAVSITHEDIRMNFLLAESAERSYKEGRPVAIGGP